MKELTRQEESLLQVAADDLDQAAEELRARSFAGRPSKAVSEVVERLRDVMRVLEE